MNDIAVLLKTVAFSAERHRSQRRKGIDASPYINHPVEVANLLANIAGITDLSTLVAAVLHDTVEDTDTSPEEIERLFGRIVRGLVEQVTDDKTLPKAERKRLQVEHTRHLSTAAKLIKMADKISNVRDVIQDPPETWSRKRQREYLDWAEQVVDGCRGISAPLDNEFDEVVRTGRKVLSESNPEGNTPSGITKKTKADIEIRRSSEP